MANLQATAVLALVLAFASNVLSDDSFIKRIGYTGVKGSERAEALTGSATFRNGPSTDRTDVINAT